MWRWLPKLRRRGRPAPIRRGAPRVPWTDRLLESILVTASRALRRRSPERWRKVLERQGGGFSGGPEGTPRAVNALQPGLYGRSTEGLTQHGAPVVPIRTHHDAPNALAVHAEIPAWAREIVPFLANQLSEHTRRAYETDLKQFFRFLETRPSGFGDDTMRELRAEHIILFRKALEEGRLTGKPLEKATVNRKLAVVKSFFNWLQANHVVHENPARLVKGFPQSQESSLKGLSDAEARRMLDLPNRSSRSGALHSAILHTLLFLGLRKGELIGLRLGDLDEERGVPVLKVRGKGHRVRILPLTTRVRLAIDNYLAACQRDRSDKTAPLFTPTKNPRTGEMLKPLNPNAITYIVARYARKAGILKAISPHSCRATCISNALDRRATHRSVQHLAGWSTPLMIQRYDKRREELKNSAAFVVAYEPEADEAKPSGTG